MGISEEQRLERMRFIGASDVGKIMGASRFGNQKDVYISKVYSTDDSRLSRAAYRGVLLEPTVLKWASEYEGLIPDGFVMDDNIRYVRYSENRTPFASNCDAVVWTGDQANVESYDEEGNPRELNEVPISVVEAKTSKFPEDWGKAGTDQIPDTYLYQVMTQMWCSGCVVGWVPVLLGALDFRMYRVDYNAELMGLVLDECDKFWWHVENEVTPEGPPPRMEAVREIVRDTESVIELDPSLTPDIYEWRRLCNEKNKLIKAEAQAKADLILALEDCEIGVVPEGHLSYTRDARGARTLRWIEDSDGQADA